MELLVFSDSHGSLEEMKRALALCRTKPDGILHLGDGVASLDQLSLDGIFTYGVRGNCDFFDPRPEEIVMSLGGHVLLMTHGHRYGVKGGLGALIAHAVEVHADVVLFGHTHRMTEQYLPRGSAYSGGSLPKELYLLNPGSIGSGEHSFGRLLLKKDTVLFSTGLV